MPTPKKADPRHGGGNPKFELTAAKLKQVEKLSEEGLWEKDIAALIGVHPNYFPEIKRRHPELVEAIAKGKANQIKKALSVVKHHVGKKNLDAAKFILRSRGGYSEDGKQPLADDVGRDKESTADRILANIRKHRERESK